MTFDWRTEISLGGFSSGAEMRWETVKSWESFTEYFDDAVRLDAVTYCESPDLLLELFDRGDFDIETMDVLVGNREEYQSSIDDVSTAERLVEYYQAEKIVVRLKNRKVIHSKLYRIEHDDGRVTLLVGSANLSYNSWRNQTNDILAFYTQTGSELDRQFQEWLADHRSYSDEILMENLVAQLEAAEDEDEREQKLELWISGRDTSLTERGELHTDGNQQLDEIASEVDRLVAEVDDPADADDTVTMTATGDGDAPDSTGTDETADIELEEAPTVPANEVSEGDSEAEGAAVTTPITAARTNDVRFSLSTTPYEGNYVTQLADGLKQRDATINDNAITTSVSAYTNYLEDRYDVPPMRIAPEAGRVTLQSGSDHRSLAAQTDPTPADLDTALANLEAYLETVDRWGTTNNPTAVKAHMYEAILFGMWAPFVNLYAAVLFERNVTLDNALQYLYIFGDSDAGKDIFTEFLLRLLSDGLVTEGAEADETGKASIRALKDLDTAFPYVVSDISKSKIENLKPVLANFWQKWTPTNAVSYPTIIFTSNDSRPKEWFRNRTKMLHFDVTFPSNPEDEHWQAAQEDLNPIMEERNHLFAWVARQILTDKPYRSSSQTVGDVREIVLDFYATADREVPDYFPREPANRVYNIGKRKWRNAFDRGDIAFERRDSRLIAEFEMEQHELYSYLKTLPTRMRAEKSGRKLIIKNPEEFVTWLERSVDSPGMLGRLNRLFR